MRCEVPDTVKDSSDTVIGCEVPDVLNDCDTFVFKVKQSQLFTLLHSLTVHQIQPVYLKPYPVYITCAWKLTSHTSLSIPSSSVLMQHTKQHSVTSRKTWIFSITAVRTADLELTSYCYSACITACKMYIIVGVSWHRPLSNFMEVL